MRLRYMLFLLAVVLIGVVLIRNRPLSWDLKMPDLADANSSANLAVANQAILYADESSLAGRCAKSLLIVEGDEGAGTGSIINLKGNPLIVTTVHVLSGNANPHFKLLNSAGSYTLCRTAPRSTVRRRPY
jgi:hypothetical protein